MVLNEQGQVTYTRMTFKNDASHDSSVVLNEQGLISSEQRRLRKTKGLSLRIRTWNIGSLTSRFFESIDIMERMKINTLYLQKTKWVRDRAKMIVDESQEYKLWCSRKIEIEIKLCH